VGTTWRAWGPSHAWLPELHSVQQLLHIALSLAFSRKLANLFNGKADYHLLASTLQGKRAGSDARMCGFLVIYH